jgi:preprotein translocase subunit YajC
MGSAGFLIVMVLVFVVFYVLAVRPQRQRQAEHQSRIDRVEVDDDVLTTGGIYGTVVQADGDDLVVQIADGVEVHMTRRGIAVVLPPENEDEEDDDEYEDEYADEYAEEEEEPASAEADEPVEEESVTGAADETSRTGDRS